MSDNSPLSAALANHKVSAQVSDLDHRRIGAGFAVETDYIISVEPTSNVTPDESFETYKLSKTYSAFRTLGTQLKQIAETAAKQGKDWDSLPPEVKQNIKFAESVNQLVQSQRTQYIGKVNFMHVKSIAQQRSQTINDVLESILRNFPSKSNGQAVEKEMASAIELFFLTDHVEEDDATTVAASASGRRGLFTPGKEAAVGELNKAKKLVTSPVVPVTRKHRKSVVIRAQDEAELMKADEDQPKLFLDDERNQKTMVPSYSAPVPVVRSNGSKFTEMLENNPYVFMLITLVALVALRSFSYTQVTIDTDVFLLIIFAFFCLGFHLPRPARIGVDTAVGAAAPVVTFQKQPAARRASTASGLLRKSMASPMGGEKTVGWEDIVEEEEAQPLIKSPMDVYPEGAPLGKHFNCWSQPSSKDFKVRGPNYLRDKKKVHSDDFLFPCRGADLFLTDLCPENVGRISGVMGGMLREKPTFLINYRLPWGVFVVYYEIPERFLPFLYKRYEADFDDSKLPSLDEMTPADRCVSRWLMEDDKYKDERLKIVPVVLEGPWIVKAAVGGKPAIIGTKMPVSYVYQKQQGEKALYLEADLDIVASSAARGVLSVVRPYTNVLTLDIGYVIEGKREDELPECMLVGSRMHGIDPMSAPPLPPMKDMYESMGEESDPALTPESS